MKDLKKSLLLTILTVCWATQLLAQSPTANLSGRVTDEKGGDIAGATVTAKNSATANQRVTQTDDAGNYTFTALEPGVYDVSVEANGFKTTVQKGVTLSVGGSVTSDVALTVGAVSEQVTVDAQTPLIETTQADISRVIDQREIESLPNIGRNFVDFVKLSSGVTLGRENVGGGPFKEPDVGVGAVSAPRLSFGGQTELNTLIQVDGVDNIQTFTGLPRATPSQEAASEFRILNSTYLAEYGRSMGGFVNIITRSGTNRFNGSAYYYGVNDALNARSILNDVDTDVLRQNQFGGTFGGPIKADKTFFFVNYEGQRRAESNRFAQVYRDNFTAINAMRRRFNLTPEVLDQVRTNDYDQILTRIDQIVGKSAFALRYNFLNSDTVNFLGGGSRAASSSSTARNNQVKDQALVLSAVSGLSARLTNEARFQYARRSFDFPTVRAEPAIEVTNLLTAGKSTSDVDYYQEQRLQLIDNVGYALNNHQLKFGADYNHISDKDRWAIFFPARIVFPSLPALVNFTPTSVSGPVLFWWPVLLSSPGAWSVPVPFSQVTPTQYGDSTSFSLKHSSFGVFAQDQWRVNSKINLTFGLRYDVEKYPSQFILKNDNNNFQPRVGISYAWNEKGVIRAGFGIFNDRLASSVGQVFNTAAFSSRGNLPNAEVLFPGIAPIAGVFRQTTLAGPPATAATINFLTTGTVPANGNSTLNDTVNGALKTPYSTQFSLSASQELPGGLALTLSFLHVGGRQLLGHTPNLNVVQTATLASGKPIFGARRFTELGDFHITTNVGESTYNGGTIELKKRFSKYYGFTGSYTWSKTITDVDSVSSLADFPEAAGVSERALSRQHLPHRFTLSFLSEIPKSVPVFHDFKFSAISSIESGRYFTLYVGTDVNLDGNPLSDRPGALGRNTLQGPGYATVDLRVARELKFNERLSAEFTFDAFNALNRVNIRDISTVYGSANLSATPIPSYGTVRDVFNPRQFQFGIKLRF